nr:topoisomerase DNA-binding C4 zinc finger domain-containing protein [Fonticella tunisiensis]
MFAELSKEEVKTYAAVSSEKASVPTCPKCGIPMVLREEKKGDRAGEKFYGCSNFHKCREVVRY